MKRLLLLMIALFVTSLSHSQDLIEETAYEDSEYIYWTTWKDNWFITAGIGYEYRWIPSPIEGFNLNGAVTYDIAVGKWITPFFGVQLKYNRTPINGHCDYANIFVDQNNDLVGALTTVHLDLMFNLIAIIKGYKHDRFYRISPYVGAGVSIPSGNGKSYTKDYITFGIINTFRISNTIAAKLTFKSSASNYGHFGVEEAYQRERIFPVSATAGIIYRFPFYRGYKQPKAKEVEVVKYVEKVVERVVEPKEAKVRIDTVTIEKVVRELYFAGSVVHFELNSSKLSKQSRVNLSYVAAAIKAFPEDRVFKVIGHCDVQTGSVEWNEGLSLRRAQAVYDCLVNEFGVDKSRLEIDHKGGVDYMFYNDNTLSRVVIMQ
ncbi:MAG: OmpA family protein [Rikenellaceae bacterium]